MTLRINDEAPNFTASTTEGVINFHEWIGDGWVVFVSHPKDFTPICTTELGLMARMESEFAKRNTKIIGHSIDGVESHLLWIRDIAETQGVEPHFPIIGDDGLEISKLYDMLPGEAVAGERSIAENATVRAVFIIGPDKRIKLMSSYPMSVGRNFDEVLRSIDSLQLAHRYRIATPVNWMPGDLVLIPPSISDDEAKELFPQGFTTTKPGGGPESSQRPYLRYVDLEVAIASNG